MRVPRRVPEKARIEIIPMIDVIFFLLVFFMISTLSMTMSRGLPVNLPTAATSQKEMRENVNLTVTQDGKMFLNKQQVTLQDIFVFEKSGLTEDNLVRGRFRATGVRPKFYERLQACGLKVPLEIFQSYLEVN